ncbi:formylglycine-generating enzyme family protein [Candidatus Electronema sp. PJ]|uniref:formylglycine-generating enzyme family protein n=1 Tax=Candidatus Electronema sp. PJ TaxID=3401572 RepID=UPI003AA7D323
MNRLGTVSRADLLRLLATCPDAPLITVARLTGFQEQAPAAVPIEEAVYETEPAESPRPCPLERFWHLHSREPLQTRLGRPRLRPQDISPLPAELRHVHPLQAKDLHWADCPASPRLNKQPSIPQLLAVAVRQRPLPRRFAAMGSESDRQTSHPPAALALELLRAGQLTDRSQADWLEHFILRLVRTWFDRRKDAELLDYAHQILELLPEQFRRQHHSAALLYGIVHRDSLRQGMVIPPEYRPEVVLTVVQEPLPPAEWLLIQEGEDIFLVNSPERGICLLKGSRIAGLDLTSDIILLHRQGRTETAPVQTRLPLCTLSSLDLEQFWLQTRTERLHLTTCTRPLWASLIGRNSRDLFVEIPWLGKGYRLCWQVPVTGGVGCWSSSHGPVSTDRFGLSAYIGFYGRVMQRFRWLEPGRFLMGSPLDEPEREAWGKETQHEVRLTKGFWLADTTVSQELWQFVMHSNPSRFQGRALPVENVSWHDTQVFLERLNAMVPGLAARLPTEAEWEYACRAGTTTPFAFGKQITPEQVNYNGNYPYQSKQKGQCRRQTVAVGSLPANPWGLYEMHGNLWEWCQDWWQEDLGYDAALDPQGLESSEFRVVRGGSWFLSGKGVRSAVRGRFAAEFRNDRIGFRIARDNELVPDQDKAAAPALVPEPTPSPSFLRWLFGRK